MVVASANAPAAPSARSTSYPVSPALLLKATRMVETLVGVALTPNGGIMTGAAGLLSLPQAESNADEQRRPASSVRE